MRKVILLFVLITISGTICAQTSVPRVDAVNKRLIFNSESHLKDFIDFYTANDSEEALDQVVETLESKGFESLLNVEKRIKYLQNKGITVSDENIEDDILIGDDRLACLLNNDRQIVVGSRLFKYEDDGLYFTERITSNINQKINAKKGMNKSSASLTTETINSETVYNLGDDLMFFSYEYKNSIDFNDDYDISKDLTNKSTANDPYAPPYTLKYCDFDDSGFFESLLSGSVEVCKNYINDDKRIRTKFSSQNYFLFSSVYTKVKSQKRKKIFGISTWNRDNFCNYLEMGRTVVIKFPVEYPSPPVFTNSFLVKDNGFNRVIDINGNTTYTDLEGLTNVFDKFPFDNGSFNYEIYFYIGTYNLTPKNVNKLVADGIKGLLKSLGKEFNDLFGKETNTSVGLTLDTPDGIYIAEYGQKSRKYGISKLSKTYDWNFEITFESSVEDFFGDLLDNINLGTFLNGKTSEVTVLDVYGFGSYNGSVYGSRIIKGSLNERNPNGIDSDADGVPDHEDFCPYQKGIKKYGGCPYSLIDKQGLYANRINEINEQLDGKSTNGSDYSFGACYNLELRSADYPISVNKITGGHYNNYNIIAGKQITINGKANINIKPEGNTKSITLKIQNNACDISQPESLQKILNSNTKNNNRIVEKENTKEVSSFTFFPNPISNILYLQDKNGISRWSIMNKLGEEILSDINSEKNVIEINTSSLTEGMYFLNVAISNGYTINKTIIKK